jgi:hypothetical protein
VIGFRKWALAAYLVLAIYLLSNPSADQLVERSQAFDEHLGAQPTGALGPALAAVLEIPVESVDCHLQLPKAKPSELVFEKLLDRRGSARGNADATTILESGISMREAIGYFDKVEKAVTKKLKAAGDCGGNCPEKGALHARR